MKTYNSFLGKQLFLSTDNKLIEIKLIKETITSDCYMYEYIHNNEEYELCIGKNNDKFTSLFYTNEENYYDSCPCTPNNSDFAVYRYDVHVDEDGVIKTSRIVFENNMAVCKDMVVDKIVSTYRKYDVILADNVETYYNKVECYAWNKVDVVGINGEEVPNSTGHMREFSTFTDEQKKAIEKLRKAIEEVNKTCTFLCSDGGLFVMNGKHDITDEEWAECNGEDYISLPYYHKGFIQLPFIERNYCDNPCVKKNS